MKHVLLAGLIPLLAGISLTSVARAALGPDNNDVRVSAHAVPGCTQKGCDPLCSADPVVNEPTKPCSQYTVNWPLNTGAFVYVVAGRGGSVGISGLSFGIDYNPGDGSPVMFVSGELCADGLEFPSVAPNIEWPNPRSGNRITWATCQNTEIAPDGVHATAYSFYVYAYSDDTFQIGPHTALASADELDVTDCSSSTTKLLSEVDPPLVPSLTAKVQFGAGSGVPAYEPCSSTSTEDATWGQLKTHFPGRN